MVSVETRAKDLERYHTDPEYNARKKAHARASYARNREKVIARQQEVRKEIAAYLLELRKGPCADCKQTYNPACMQFHHKPGVKKRSCVASLGSMVTLKDELTKCELLCANCHAIRHYGGTDNASV